MRSGEDTVEDSGVSEAERTRISSAKLLSSPSRALTASKSNTNWRQQAQCYWGRCAFHGQAREGVAAHLRERGLCSLVWCFQRGEDPACGQDKQDGQQTGAPGCERKRRTWRAHSGAGVRDLPFGGLPKFGWTSASGYTQMRYFPRSGEACLRSAQAVPILRPEHAHTHRPPCRPHVAGPHVSGPGWRLLGCEKTFFGVSSTCASTSSQRCHVRVRLLPCAVASCCLLWCLAVWPVRGCG